MGREGNVADGMMIKVGLAGLSFFDFLPSIIQSVQPSSPALFFFLGVPSF